MILNKKGFMMLPLAALLFATSCAKQINYGEAVNFVKDNYTSKDPKKPTKLTANFFADVPNAETRKEVKRLIEESIPSIQLTEEGNKLKYNVEIKKESDLPDLNVITVDYLKEPKDDFKVTYSLSGKSLSMDFSVGIKNENIPIEEIGMNIDIKEAKIEGSAGVNDQGYPARAKVKIKIDATVSMNPTPEFASNEAYTFDLKLDAELSVNATY